MNRRTGPKSQPPGIPGLDASRHGGGQLVLLLAMVLGLCASLHAGEFPPCSSRFRGTDAAAVATPEGALLYARRVQTPHVPASTLKILTALAALRTLGPTYRFVTEFYLDAQGNLKVKGYGDPLLISEVWKGIAGRLAREISGYRDLILDRSYFSQDIRIPGRHRSTNPYDAPVGALCANFNTIFFERDAQGRIVSAEAQTPLLPFALRRIRALRLKRGRYTFTHDREEAARYAGELLAHFLAKRGVYGSGNIRPGLVSAQDRLLLAHASPFPLEEVVRKMLAFSNNFVANQLVIALGARAEGPPGTLDKGLRVIRSYAENHLQLERFHVAEGSGISHRNRMTAAGMLKVLQDFMPYRRLLKRRGPVLYKTGSLHGIRARAGYLEPSGKGPHPFVVFLHRDTLPLDPIMDCLSEWVGKIPSS